MSGISKKLMGTTAVGGALAIEDVFSTYLYTGNGSTQTITNGIDLAGEGGLVWIKDRTGAYSHNLVDSERSVNNYLFTDLTSAQFDAGSLRVSSFNSDGFSLGSGSNGTNRSGDNHASWTFRKAPRFFDVVTYTGDGAAIRAIPHNLGTTVGVIVLKRTDSTSYWWTYHRSRGATKYINLQANTAEAAAGDYIWGQVGSPTEPTDTDFYVGAGGGAVSNTSGATYVAYLFAHDPLGESGDGSDGLIACGSQTLSGSTFFQEELGWEPQWVLWKMADGTGDWNIMDNMRPDFTATASAASATTKVLKPNSTSAEASNNLYMGPHSSGFGGYNLYAGTYIYIAIRRGPMRPPTSGTEVFNPDYLGNTVSSIDGYLGNPSDFYIRGYLSGSSLNAFFGDRMRGAKYLKSSSTDIEANFGASSWDNMLGFYSGSAPSTSYITYNFRRAPCFFDVVAYTGTGTLDPIGHNLTVSPELIIYKRRSSVQDWWVVDYVRDNYGKLNLTNAFAAAGTSSYPVTATTMVPYLNTSGQTYIAYLFASCPGVSKVGSFVYDSTLGIDVDCGFTSGARFVLCKKTTGTGGSWFVFDTARGIVAGNDPTLELNNTNAEYSTYDLIDPLSSGFRIPVNSFGNGTYIYLAIA